MNRLKKTLERALIEGGRIMANAFYQPKKIKYKTPVSLVTKTDQAVERKIIAVIKTNFPDHSILAEESPPQGISLKKWIIDPIDGTTNFAHGLPMACVSIGYEEDGIVKLGGVWNPIMDEWFWAEHGKGASLNGKKIHVTKTKKLKETLLVTGFPYDRRKRAFYYLKFYEVFMMKTHGVRRLGSAALDLCFVAAGRFDGYWEFSLNPWDVAAGYLIAMEAGARLTNFAGKPMNIYEPQLLVTNGHIHKQMLHLIQRHM
jgi:myo-inositol-1(or 4)-monophosphatase